jgi:sulfur-carrier protein
VAVLRLFAGAREAAGTGHDDVPGATVSDVLAAARARYGPTFADVLEHCQVWCNGEPCALEDAGGRRGRGRGAAAGLRGHRLMATRQAAPRAVKRRRPPPPTRGQRFRRRYAVVYDIDGPRVRLGMLWFVVAAAAIAIGPLTTALAYGGTAAVAGAQTARVWRRRKERPNEVVAAAMAGATALGACLGAGGAGLGLLAGVAAALVVAVGDTRSPNRMLADAGWTIQCALFPGLTAMSMVLLARLDQGSAIALLLLVSAYETGDYIVGSGARNPYEGPAAGLTAIVVVTFIVSTLPISALSFGEAWFFGGLVGVLAPIGQLLASALLPSAGSPASALRRLDSLLLAAPAWWLGLAVVL